MNDHLGIFDRGGSDEHDDEVDLTDLRHALANGSVQAPAPSRVSVRQQVRARHHADRRRQRRRRRSTFIAVVVMALIVGGVVIGYRIWQSNRNTIPDYAGTGDTEVIIRIQSNDSLDDIARKLEENQVVASAEGFASTTANDAEVKALQPGYYKLRQHASVAATADALVDPDNRVGRMRLIPGRQLADVSATAAGATTTVAGYITEITKSACVPLNGQSNCFTADQLWEVAETALPTDLGVVGWAVNGVTNAPDRKKRLEGVILPGDYDVPPNTSPLETLREVVTASAALWNQSEIIADSKSLGMAPYQVATIASIVEREGKVADMPKVARVIYNRLRIGMKLQMDSTVNYALNRAQISTTAADRANPSPYNTYVHTGLPPTPISSPGVDALDATVNPADGGWKYFVKVDLAGNSCFSVTDVEHARCVELARKNGVFG